MPKRNSNGVNKEIKKIQKPIGASGTNLLNGFLREEYLSELQFPYSSTVYEKMIKGDAQVKASLNVCVLPILAATWNISGIESEDKQLAEASEFIYDALFNKVDFEQLLREKTRHMSYLDSLGNYIDSHNIL